MYYQESKSEGNKKCYDSKYFPISTINFFNRDWLKPGAVVIDVGEMGGIRETHDDTNNNGS